MHFARCVSGVAIVMPLCLFSLYINFSMLNYNQEDHDVQQSKAKRSLGGPPTHLRSEPVLTKRRNDVGSDEGLGKPPCLRNPFANSLNKSLATVASKANTWRGSLNDRSLKASHMKENHFSDFQEMASCRDLSCLGGNCESNHVDDGRRFCGLQSLEEECVIYSAYRGNNSSTTHSWQMELTLLDLTPCIVHVFDCDMSEDEAAKFNELVTQNSDDAERLVFHPTCLGEQNPDAPTTKSLGGIRQQLGHDRIDILTMNMNGYEISLLQSWSDMGDHESDHVLPMQLVTRLHYPSEPTSSAKQATMTRLQEQLLNLGYATVGRNDNVACDYCSTDLTMIRFQCPQTPLTVRKENKAQPKTRNNLTRKSQGDNKNTTSLTGSGESKKKQEKLNVGAPYSQSDIYGTVPHFGGHPMRLLVFDGEENTFNTYNILHNNGKNHKSPDFQTSWCRRCSTLVPILVNALRTSYPKRFTKGSPPFQVMFSTNDSILTNCVNNPKRCTTSKFAPIISFGTVPSDPDLLPSLLPFPLHFFEMCMFNWLAGSRLQTRQKCKFINKTKRRTDGADNATVPASPKWDDLKPQVIWRGTDYKFSVAFKDFKNLLGGKELLYKKDLDLESASRMLLETWDTLRPRWRGMALSLQAELQAQRSKNERVLPWIDCKFVATNSKSFDESHPSTKFVTAPRMGAEDLSQYKYHVDFGGVGGTTWLGTITKLAMPGLLFHHVTAMRDWFFDEIQPWVHYVPVKLDLSDLHDKYEWAESHPEEAQKIAKGGTEFALNMMSEEYMRHTHQKYFVTKLGGIVDAYHPDKEENMKSILEHYKANDFEIHQFATCGEDSCVVRTRRNAGWNLSLPLGVGNRFDEEDNPVFYSSNTS